MRRPVPLPERIQADVAALVTTAKTSLASTQTSIRRAVDAATTSVPAILEDLGAFASRDAAAHADPQYIYESYLSFHALLAHRVAHAVYRMETATSHRRPAGGNASAARLISEIAKARTGVEIHPAATIGQRMIIDHGWGTVIGEHATLGDDCYILQNVVLGCRHIRAVPDNHQRRHPAIGNRVTIAGDVCIFGPVSVGDDCRIDAGARVTTDVPAASHVRVRTRLQVVRSDSPPATRPPWR
ncbi:serine acetyltransferase [Streptomyces sp. NPDC023327]|uniref:serine O-acetyltransferase n=1 Tax=Streptomyces sp. NPDC023327 TaxID=3157088 RepID=UPI0033F36B94